MCRRRGEGDCSEHGVLLAALLRADDIPARVCYAGAIRVVEKLIHIVWFRFAPGWFIRKEQLLRKTM